MLVQVKGLPPEFENSNAAFAATSIALLFMPPPCKFSVPELTDTVPVFMKVSAMIAPFGPDQTLSWPAL